MKKILTSMRVDVSLHGEARYGLAEGLVTYFEALGYALFPIPNRETLVDLVVADINPDGILLSGGNDLNPELYGGERGNSLNVYPERDQTEMRLLEFAVKNRKPVLGICRGFQMINVFFKGSLLEDISVDVPDALEHVASRHPLRLMPFALAGFLKGFNSPIVNSYHRQGFTLNELSLDFEALALSSDGIIEAARHKTKPILGFMWHPERKGSDASLDEALIYSIFQKP